MQMTPWEVATQSTWCRSLDSKGKYTKIHSAFRHSVVAQYRALRACFNFLSWKTCPYVTVDTKIFHRSLIIFPFTTFATFQLKNWRHLYGARAPKKRIKWKASLQATNSLCNFFPLLNDIQREWTNPDSVPSSHKAMIVVCPGHANLSEFTRSKSCNTNTTA